jgi:hypothetical protein
LTRVQGIALSPQIEPYLADTSRAGAEWFTALFEEFFVKTGRECHLRGAHYVAVSVEMVKPDGTLYQNTKSDYDWLGRMATAARWLGLVDPDAIGDERNDEPFVSFREAYDDSSEVNHGLTNQIGEISISPWIGAAEMEHAHERQPYTLVVYGEKSSLRGIVEPICREFGADMFLPAGELSITHAHQMAKRAVADGRKLILFTLTDCDPWGHQMTVSAAHKLRAFADGKFAADGLEFEVIPVALTIDQAVSLKLPSTMLKASGGSRVERWKEAHEREGTEIDALIALHPEFLAQELRKAMAPYFDADLHGRMTQAHDEWRSEAEAAIEDQVGDEIEALKAEYGPRMAELKACLMELEGRLQEVGSKVTLPSFDVPKADIPKPDGDGVFVSSDMDYREHVLACQARKRYGLDDVAAAA